MIHKKAIQTFAKPFFLWNFATQFFSISMQFQDNLVYLLLGGNVGDVRKVFSSAMDEISQHIGDVCNISPLYRSEPWGFQSAWAACLAVMRWTSRD